MRSRLAIALALLSGALALAGLAPMISRAASSGSIQRQIDRKKAAIGAHRSREQLLTTDIAGYSRRIGALQGSITKLQGRQVRLQASLDGKRAQLAQTQARLRAEKLRLIRLRARLAQARVALAQRLVEIYKDDQPDIVTVVLNANGFADLLERADFMQRVSSQDARIIDAVRTAKAAATASAQRLGALERTQARIAAAMQAERDQVAAVKGQLVSQRERYSAARAQKAAVLVTTRSQRHKLEDDVAALQRQQSAIQAKLAAAAGPAVAASGPVRPGSGGLIWPVNGPITSLFCERRAWERCHPGIDIGVPEGTPIHAAAAGTVVLMEGAGSSGGYGNYTCVQHTAVMSTCYAHQSRFATSTGAHVAQGQVIGYTGCTGLCFGPHLHFEVRLNGAVTNPLNYL